ncbi:MAG: hydroxymethylbilane synthase, partial [Fibrobacter sp.]|nr:hydroxymethylbilane synthase [Fibrobacter sp.]
MRRKIRIATRGSKLAQAQAMSVVSLLEKVNTDTDYEIVTISTIGDRVTDKPLSTFRGMGVFVKEIQAALLTHEVDIAVHSLKDVPVDRPDELTLTCYLKRENPFDILLTRTGAALHELEKGAVIGTSSARRSLQLRAIRNDLEFRDIRGNLDTRIKKLNEGMYDGIVVAAAGMNRLGREFSKSSLL